MPTRVLENAVGRRLWVKEQNRAIEKKVQEFIVILINRNAPNKV